MVPHIKAPLYYEQLGRHGRPMIFVHPNPMDLTCWIYQTAHFSYWYRTVAVDLPGYGQSPHAEEGLTVGDMAEACWQAGANVSDEPAIIFGLSVGSAVVQMMAYQRPERTAAVVMSGAGYRPPGDDDVARRRVPSYQEQGIAFRRGHTLEDWSPDFRQTDMGQYFADIFAQRNDGCDVESIVQVFESMAKPRPDDVEAGIKAPTLIVSGSLDNAHKRSYELQKRIPKCEHVTMEDAGHACNMERPWEWDNHVLHFLARHHLFDGDLTTGRR
jgi:pimeloyl-ACP methyl ester carboxylesterase